MSTYRRAALCALLVVGACTRRRLTWHQELVAGLAAGTLDRTAAATLLGIPPGLNPDDATTVPSRREGIFEARVGRHPALPPSDYVVDVQLAPTQSIALTDLVRIYGPASGTPIMSANFVAIFRTLMIYHPSGAPYEVRIHTTACRDLRRVCALYFDRYRFAVP